MVLGHGSCSGLFQERVMKRDYLQEHIVLFYRIVWVRKDLYVPQVQPLCNEHLQVQQVLSSSIVWVFPF